MAEPKVINIGDHVSERKLIEAAKRLSSEKYPQQTAAIHNRLAVMAHRRAA